MSSRSTVIDAIVTALEGVSDIKTVTREYISWWDSPAHKFPVVIVRDLNTALDRHAFLDSSANDMEAVIEIACTGVVHDMNNVVAAKRDALIEDIEQTLVGNATLEGLTINVEPKRIETDNGDLDNYSIFDVVFDVDYLYNHASP